MQGKYHEPPGAPPEARLNRYKKRYAEAESRCVQWKSRDACCVLFPRRTAKPSLLQAVHRNLTQNLVQPRPSLGCCCCRYGMRPNVNAAVTAYSALARSAGMLPTEMALRSAYRWALHVLHCTCATLELLPISSAH